MSPPAGPGRNALHTKRSLPVFDDQENQNPLATAGAPVCSSPEVKDFGSQPAPKRQKKHSTCHEEQQLDVSLSPRTAPSPDSSDTPQVVSSQVLHAQTEISCITVACMHSRAVALVVAAPLHAADVAPNALLEGALDSSARHRRC